MNIAELHIKNIEKFGEYKSLYYEGEWFTNVGLDKRAQQVAHGLAELGVKPGDRVATVLGNCPEVINIFHACFRMGAWAMPVMFTLTGEEIGYVLKDSGAEVVVTQELFIDKVKEAVKNAPSVKNIVTVDNKPVEGTVHMQKWFKEYSGTFQPVKCDENDPAILMYTSGTTGQPKGIMLSHNNLYSNAISAAKSQKMEVGETGISALPLNHSYGIIINIASSEFKGGGVLMAWFDATKMLEYIDEFKCQGTALVPAMLIQILNHPELDKYDLSSMKRWMCAAAPLAVELRKRFEDRINGKVLEGYGLTECSPAVSADRPDRVKKDGSVGLPIEGVQVSIRDSATSKELPTGEIGEICVKGPNVMLGYYNRPEETEKVIRDGWLYTGDAGYLDSDNYIFLTERIKDLIIRGGENIFPKDIEDVLIKHPKVSEASVIGMPDEKYGEEVMAVIVPAPGEELSAEDVTDFCNDRLGKFQIPKRIEFVQALPKNLLGKVLKKDIRKQYFQ